MCTGLTFECFQLITKKLSLYVKNNSFLFNFFVPIISRLRCLNIAWTKFTRETIKYLCATIPRCIEQLNISGQRYILNDDRKNNSFVVF